MFDSAAPMFARDRPSPAFPTSTPRPRHARPHVSSEQLLHGARELVIEHAGQEYHLRLTRNDKLILTK